MAINPRNVFAGSLGMENFLNPENHPPTPLVELDASLNPFLEDGIHILAKLAFLSPLLTIKWLPAYNLLEEAHLAGNLEGVEELIENSSGGTAFAMKIIATVVYAIKKFRAIVPRDMAPGKLESLRLMGIDYEFSGGEMSGPLKAKEEGAKPGRFNPGQYHNDANWRAHERWLAPEIWEQTDGSLSIYAAAMGTTGTIIGPSRYFRSQGSNIAIVGVTPTKDQVPGARTLQRIDNDVEFDWRPPVIDQRIDIEPEEAYRKSHDLWRRGILAGPSSGLAFAGVLKFLEENRADWDKFRNGDGEIVAVFPCPDIAQLYAEKYSTHLDPADLA